MGATGSNISNTTKNSTPELDKNLIRRSNDVSAFDMGDSINREYQNNITKINEFNLTDTEKQEAIQTQYRLNSEALQLQSKSISERIVAGPARRVSGNTDYDKVVNKRAEVANHMKELEAKSIKNNKVDADKRLYSAMQNAIANKQLEFTVDGKTYSRKSLRSKSFTN